jgi:outer membrane protein assembly factor BamB
MQFTFVFDPIPGSDVLWHFSNGEKLTAVAAIDENNNVYCSTANRVLKISASGQQLWQGHMDNANFGVPVIKGDFVYVGGGQLWALKVSDGHSIWGKTYNPGILDPRGQFTSPVVNDNGTLFAVCGRRNFAFSADGTIIYQADSLELQGEWLSTTPVRDFDIPLLLQNGLCVYCFKDSLRAGRCDNGRLAWAFKGDDNGSPGPPASVGNDVFVVCGRSVYCLDGGSNSRKWKASMEHDLNNEIVVTSDSEVIFGGFDKLYVYDSTSGEYKKTLALPGLNRGQMAQDALALGSGNLVYVGGNFGVACIDRKKGRVLWTSNVGGGFVHGLTIADSGRIVVRGEDGISVLLGDAERGPEHPWPMLHGNPTHTGRAKFVLPSRF